VEKKYEILSNKEPIRKLLSMGWACTKNALNNVITDEKVYDQSASLNVLTMLSMIVCARAASLDLWREYSFKVGLLDFSA